MSGADTPPGGAVARRAVAHFQARKARVIVVPEWGDDAGPLEIHAAPRTLADQEKIEAALAQKDAQRSASARMVETIVYSARDAGGRRIFSAEDKPLLRAHADGEVLARIYGEMIADETPEAAEKN